MNQSENPAHAAGDTPDDSARLFPRVTAYRFRRGTLRPGQQRNWEEHWPTYGRNVSDEIVDREALFGRRAPLIVEIGSGTMLDGLDTALRGYRMDQVDAVLDRLVDELRARDHEIDRLRAEDDTADDTRWPSGADEPSVRRPPKLRLKKSLQ